MSKGEWFILVTIFVAGAIAWLSVTGKVLDQWLSVINPN